MLIFIPFVLLGPGKRLRITENGMGKPVKERLKKMNLGYPSLLVK